MFKEDIDFIDDGKLFRNTGPQYVKLRFEYSVRGYGILRFTSEFLKL